MFTSCHGSVSCVTRGCVMMSWRHGPWSVAVTVSPPRASVHSDQAGASLVSDTLLLQPRVHGSYTLSAVTAPVFIAATAPACHPGATHHHSDQGFDQNQTVSSKLSLNIFLTN